MTLTFFLALWILLLQKNLGEEDAQGECQADHEPWKPLDRASLNDTIQWIDAINELTRCQPVLGLAWKVYLSIYLGRFPQFGG